VGHTKYILVSHVAHTIHDMAATAMPQLVVMVIATNWSSFIYGALDLLLGGSLSRLQFLHFISAPQRSVLFQTDNIELLQRCTAK
jgi:hypothetical protein